MINVLRNDDLLEIGKHMRHTYNYPLSLFAENVGQAIFEQMEKDKIFKTKKNIHILLRPNERGSYGLVLAKKLIERKYHVTICCLPLNEGYSESFLYHKDIITAMRVDYVEILDLNILRELLKISDVLIESLWSINQEAIDETIADIINSQSMKISIDLPLGISNMCICNAVNADFTYTIIAPKQIFFENNNEKYIGQLKLVKLPILDEIMSRFNHEIFLLTKDYLEKHFPKRYINGNKGTYGTLGFISSENAMLGSSLLFSQAALVTGLGKLYIYTEEASRKNYLSLLPEAIVETEKSLKVFLEPLKALACGFGLGLSKNSVEIVHNLLKIAKIPLLLDADAINILAKENFDLSLYKGSSLILTPHPKEFARLLSCSTKCILNNRIALAKDYAVKNKVILVLKGRNTIIAMPSGKPYINTIDDPCLSQAGSGDILSGIISTFLAQGIEGERAAILGVIFHGLVGKIARNTYGDYSVTSGRLIKVMEKYLKAIGKRRKRFYL